MLRACVASALAAVDERNSCRVSGQVCQWTTSRPKVPGTPFLLFVGLDGAGKTTCIKTLLSGPQETDEQLHGVSDSTTLASITGCAPTSQGTLSLITSLSKPFVAIDAPGAAPKRAGWIEAVPAADGIVLVVRCTDELRYPVAREYLWRLMPKMVRRALPCLVIATRREELTAPVAPEDLVADMDLAPLMTSLPAPWALRAVCAHTFNEVAESLEWLLSKVHAMKKLRKSSNKHTVMAGFQASNMEYSAQLLAARALQQQQEQIELEEAQQQISLMRRHEQLLKQRLEEQQALGD